MYVEGSAGDGLEVVLHAAWSPRSSPSGVVDGQQLEERTGDGGDDGSAEMRFVDAVATSIGLALASGENVLVDGHKIVLTKSTVPVGTSDRIRELIGRNAKSPYVVCSNPEFRVLTDALAKAAGKSLPTLASALFQNTYSYTPTGGGVTLAWSYCSVQAVDMMYLCSVRLGSQDTYGPSGSTDTLMCAIPNQDFATVLVSSMPWDVWMECPAISTNILDFTLRDRNYNVLPDLPNISFVVSIR